MMRIGNLDARRDFVEVRDVVDAYVLAANAPSLPTSIVLNLASSEPRRREEMRELLLGLSNVPVRVERNLRLCGPVTFRRRQGMPPAPVRCWAGARPSLAEAPP